MKNYSILGIIIFSTLALFMTSCDDDDPVIPNEEELITTMTYTLVSTDGDSAVFTFQDLDGDGGNDPIINADQLKANTEYSGTIELLNETETPPENITTEVREEGLEHQFFFNNSVPALELAYDDADDDGNPIGIKTRLTTGGAGSGVLMITLKHEPNKDASGVSDGQIENAGGETDIDVLFPVEVIE